MKKTFEVTDLNTIEEILNSVEYGVLSLCNKNRPYSLPLNFVELGGEIFFHGAKKGRKIDYIRENPFASFLVVEEYSLLPSYFSNEDGSACSATQLFKSVIIDGKVELVEEFEEKTKALQGLMEKSQKEGKYIPLHDKTYEKAINTTEIFKLVPEKTVAKFKLGQNFTQERFGRVCEHLKSRGTEKDLKTLQLIKKFSPYQ